MYPTLNPNVYPPKSRLACILCRRLLYLILQRRKLTCMELWVHTLTATPLFKISLGQKQTQWFLLYSMICKQQRNKSIGLLGYCVMAEWSKANKLGGSCNSSVYSNVQISLSKFPFLILCRVCFSSKSFQTRFFSKFMDIWWKDMVHFAFCISLSHKHPGKYDVDWWIVEIHHLMYEKYVICLDILIFGRGWSRN